MNENKRKGAREWGLRSEKAVVIIYDTTKDRFLLQLKDAGYLVEPFRHKHTFFGAGLKPRETPGQALESRLKKELRAVHKQVIAKMRYWDTFNLFYGNGILGNYTCHVYVMFVNARGVDDLVYETLCDGGARQGSLSVIHRDKIRDTEFLGSLHVVANEFLKKLDHGFDAN